MPLAEVTRSGLVLVDNNVRVALPPKLADAIEELDGIARETEARYTEATNLKVTDDATYMRAGEIVAANKSADKTAGALLSPFEEVVKRAKDYLQGERLRVKNRIEEVRGILNRKMGEYSSQKQREAEAEQRRLAELKRQELEAEAERQRKLDLEAAEERRKIRIAEIRSMLKKKEITKKQAEKLLREAGAIEEADKVQAATDAEAGKKQAADVAASVTVQSSTPKVAGVVRRTNYYAECIDEDAYLRALVEEYCKAGSFGPLRRFAQVNQQAIGERAREIKDSAKMQTLYPWVAASEEKTF